MRIHAKIAVLATSASLLGAAPAFPHQDEHEHPELTAAFAQISLDCGSGGDGCAAAIAAAISGLEAGSVSPDDYVHMIAEVVYFVSTEIASSTTFTPEEAAAILTTTLVTATAEIQASGASQEIINAAVGLVVSSTIDAIGTKYASITEVPVVADLIKATATLSDDQQQIDAITEELSGGSTDESQPNNPPSPS